MGDPIEQGADEPFGSEDLGPFLEGQIRDNQGRSAFVELASCIFTFGVKGPTNLLTAFRQEKPY